MTSRTVHAILVNTFVALVSAFFLCIPTIYAYFGEMRMSYGRIPELAVSVPARLTFRLFDRFNANTLLSNRIGANIGCYAKAEGVTVFPRCMYAIPAGGTLTGPSRLKVSSGHFNARYDFSSEGACSRGELRVQVRTLGPYHRSVIDEVIPAGPGRHVEIPFDLSPMDAALHELQFRVSGVSGCVVLRHWDWADR